MNPMPEKLQRILANSYVLGGSPCSGKSTIASRLSIRYDLQVYKVDDREQAHQAKIDPARHSTMHAFMKMDWNEIWSRPVALQVREELDFYQEKSEMILEDLLDYDADRPLIMEGAAFLPQLIHQWGIPKNRGLYLIPSKDFQVHHYRQRPWITQILQSCDNPEQAFENWMERDHQFGQEILRQLQDYPYHSINIDGTLSLDQICSETEAYFGLQKPN